MSENNTASKIRALQAAMTTTARLLLSDKNITFIEKENGCWECNSHPIDRYGYPKITENRIQYTVSRWLYKRIYGALDSKLVVRHKCNNPACINPEHLEIGTVQDNVDDRVKRGREGNRKGSKNGRAKLNEALIPEIINRLRNFELQKDIARDLGVSQSLISRIKRDVAWKSVGRTI